MALKMQKVNNLDIWIIHNMFYRLYDKDFGKAQGDSTIVHRRSANAVQNLYLKVYIIKSGTYVVSLGAQKGEIYNAFSYQT
jgi:hypothetical protein